MTTLTLAGMGEHRPGGRGEPVSTRSTGDLHAPSVTPHPSQGRCRRREYGFTDGGAIDNGGQLTVTATRFTDNEAFNGPGGAIYNDGTLAVSSSTFISNYGSAIGNGGQATLRQDTLSGNGARTEGGAIDNSGTLTVSSTSIRNGVAGYGGGALANDDGGQVTLLRDTLSGNSAYNGGAIYNAGALTASFTTIVNNDASAAAGGIGNNGGTVQLQVDRIQSNKPSNCVNVPGCTD